MEDKEQHLPIPSNEAYLLKKDEMVQPSEEEDSFTMKRSLFEALEETLAKNPNKLIGCGG